MNTTNKGAASLSDEQIDVIANAGCRNAAGGIYATRVYEFARAIEAEVLASLDTLAPWADATNNELASMTRMFHAACADLGAINEALGLDPDDGGADPILEAIAELRAAIAAGGAQEAERYRWLRDRSNDIEWLIGAGWGELGEAEGQEFDAIVDNAMRASNGT